MKKGHEHKWECYPGDKQMLICSTPGCETMTRITELIYGTAREAKEVGAYEASMRHLNNHWLKPEGRKQVGRFINEHPITKQRELTLPTQRRLV